MEVIDKRKFDKAGNLTVEKIVEQQIEKAIAEAPRVYEKPAPILDRLLVLRTKADTTFEGTRIIVPDIAKKDPNKGVVVAVSPVLKEHGVPLQGMWVPCQVKEGDVVTFTQFTDEQFKVDDDIYVLLRIHDVKFVEPVTYAVAAN